MNVEGISTWTWPKGHPELWKRKTARLRKLSAPVNGDALIFVGTFEQLNQTTYQPLATTNEPYGTYANIGRKALEASGLGALVALGDTVQDPGRETVNLSDSDRPALFAMDGMHGRSTEKEILNDVLKFVRQWGPPNSFDGDGPFVLPIVGVLADAIELYSATLLAAREQRLRLQGDLRGAGQVLVELTEISRPWLDGVRLRWESLECGDLLAAMWFQLHQDALSGRPWHRCEGCQRLFVGEKGTRHRFHDRRCRYQAQYRHGKGRPRTASR